MYEVQKGVPIPPRELPPRGNRLYPFETMQVGEMFFVPNRQKNNLGGYVWAAAKRYKRRFSTRMTYMRQEDSKWVQTTKDDPSGVRGIAVWRTA